MGFHHFLSCSLAPEDVSNKAFAAEDSGLLRSSWPVARTRVRLAFPEDTDAQLQRLSQIKALLNGPLRGILHLIA